MRKKIVKVYDYENNFCRITYSGAFGFIKIGNTWIEIVMASRVTNQTHLDLLCAFERKQKLRKLLKCLPKKSS